MDDAVDTIAAIATPPGRGGIGIIRVSGPRTPDIAQAMTGQLPKPRNATFADFLNDKQQPIDAGIALYFPAPHSFTGEHILELQGHGGPVVMDMLLQRVVELGARPARPGEFSERAFLNNKIDLVQAEAIADLIDSASTQAARGAMRSLQGEFSQQINQLVDELTYLRAYIEAGIDFPDEEIDLLADGQVATRVHKLRESLDMLLDAAQQGALLKEGMQLVIIGPPNVGKSSLLNCLTGRDTAIVTDIAGTTRDIVRDSVHLDGMPLHITDTAGLRDTDDPVEQEGIRRARQALETADAVLFIMDDRDTHPPAALADPALDHVQQKLWLRNKCDLSGHGEGAVDESTLRLSAKTGAGIELLKTRLKAMMGFQSSDSGMLTARRRHLVALEIVSEALETADKHIQNSQGELLAEELRQAQQALGEITGQFTADDLLGEIFSAFCIGK
ncbi:MAG: tRNA uridine-5-carboxymethylaminomethyl(34) synthesis GTPase MnmE [Pseudomonadota bacterium]